MILDKMLIASLLPDFKKNVICKLVSLQKFVVLHTRCGQYRARNWNWIGLYWNRFELTKLLSLNINISKWGFRTWNNRHSCHLCSTQCIFQQVNRSCITLKKNYRSKISLRDQSHFARSKQPHFPRYVHKFHCSSLNVFVPVL